MKNTKKFILFKHRFAQLSLLMKPMHRQNPIIRYFKHHVKAIITSLDRLLCSYLSSLLTIFVISIVFSFLLVFFVAMENLSRVSNSFELNTNISLYLKLDTSENAAQSLIDRLKSDSNIQNVRYISQEEGLEILQDSMDVKGILSNFKTNPLPKVLVVTPYYKDLSPEKAESLLSEMHNIPQVEIVKVDKEWLERLYYITDLIKRVGFLLLIPFVVGVVLIIWNTVRLDLQKAHKEMYVLKMIGATDAFVRRPFLYMGFFYGVLGGALSVAIVNLALNWLYVPIQMLIQSYGSDFVFRGLTLEVVIAFLLMGSFFGFLGALFAVVKRHAT